MENQNNQESMVSKIFFFNSMLTPKIITAVYWVLLALVAISGLATMFTQSFFVGLIGTIVGLVFVRVWCELLIVLFNINDNIKKIANK